jgi:ubiquinol-cytochrome c reductase cytochrome b subunit
MSQTMKAMGATGNIVDERLHAAGFFRRSVNKVFPDHWSFMLGEIALYSFIILLLTGTYLTFFFKPAVGEVIYNGSYVPLQGIEMSEAYASTLDISFDVRGGLLIRQLHHWSALLFVAAIGVHMMRIFFTGAFRKPREMNWVIGVTLLVLGILEGFAGYSLPDDLLSGTGLRIASGIVESIPLVGTYLLFFIFGGEFPGDDFIPRLYALHILLIPGIILALITFHLMMVWFQKHTQFPGAGRTNENVVGAPFMPIYMAKAGGFFFIVFGAMALLSGVAQINPVWLYGPYNTGQVTAGSQPDWYIGWLEGALRMMPNWEIAALGYTVSLNVLIPAVVIPGLVFTAIGIYPFLEQWVTGDKREHHLLDRPRNAPVRTGLGVMGLTFYTLLWINGGNDIIADKFNLSTNAMTWFMRVAIFALPPISFVVAKRICLGLQRRDRELLLHGHETGQVRRLPSGEYYEVHAPVSEEERATLTAHEVSRPHELTSEFDENGVRRPGGALARARAKLSGFYFSDRVEPPTPEEIEAAHGHGDGHGELEAGHEEERELPSGQQ